MIVVLSLVVAIVAAIVEGRNSNRRDRWIVLCVIATAMSASFSVICFVAVTLRGPSRSSVAIVAMALMWSGVCLLLVVPRFPMRRAQMNGMPGVFVGRPQSRHGELTRRLLLWMWVIGTFVLVLIPLGYAGAFTTDPVGSVLARAVAGC